VANPDIANQGKKFSSEYQPKNRKQSTKFLTELLIKKLNKKNEIVVEGIDVETGETRKFRLVNPNKEALVMVLLREAAKGNVHAINTVFDRIEGKPIFTAEVDLPGITYIGFDNSAEK
jgi:hypothetical protein